jgi:hypothetical protein
VIEATFPGGGSGTPACEGGGAPAQQAGVFGTLACLGGPFQPDAVAPVVAIVSPHDGDVLEPGSTLAVDVDASDDVGVASVTLRVDGQLAEARTEPPWTWHFPGVPEGLHEIVAIASDGVNESESAAVVVDVREGGGGSGGGSAGGDGGDDADEGDGGDSAGDDDGGDGDGLPPGFGLDGAEAGCGCAGARHRGAGLSWLVVLLAAVGRRRRSRA